MAEQTLTIQGGTHTVVAGVVSIIPETSHDSQCGHVADVVSLIAVGESVVLFEDADVLFGDDEVEFIPSSILDIQEPCHGLDSPNPRFAGLRIIGVKPPSHEIFTTNPFHIQLVAAPPSHGLVSGRPAVIAISPQYVQDTTHGLISLKVSLDVQQAMVVQGPVHVHAVFNPELTTGGGQHSNTEHIIYNAHDYLRCRHQHGNLTGVYTSPIFDTAGAADRYLAYIVGQDTAEPDIVVVGTGTTWDSQLPDPNTWQDVGVASNSWTNIFTLAQGPSVTMRLYYGETSPPLNYCDKMEILSAIVEDARYFQVQITITDPGLEIYAYVEKFYIRLCQ